VRTLLSFISLLYTITYILLSFIKPIPRSFAFTLIHPLLRKQQKKISSISIMKLSFFLFLNFACAANADHSLRGGESTVGTTNRRSLQAAGEDTMMSSPFALGPGESNCELHSDNDGTYVCSVRSNGSVNDQSYDPETHLACVTSGESQYCANIGLSDSPTGGGGDGGPEPGPDDMAPAEDVLDSSPEEPVEPGPDVMAPAEDVVGGPDVLDSSPEAPIEDAPEDVAPPPGDAEEPDQLPQQGGGTPPDSAIGLMPNQGGGEKCPGGKPAQGSHCTGWIPTGASEASCYYSDGATQCNCAGQDGDASTIGWQCRAI
jgi:hypothetical protein